MVDWPDAGRFDFREGTMRGGIDAASSEAFFDAR
jgi:hypothetical protein